MLLFILGTGEHGVGIGKKEFLVQELGVGTVKLMRTIKRAIDPDELFNPGKVSLSSKRPSLFTIEICSYTPMCQTTRTSRLSNTTDCDVDAVVSYHLYHESSQRTQCELVTSGI